MAEPDNRGFTLIEIAILLAVIAIFAAFAWPSLQRSRPRAELAGTATELQALMTRARQEALAQGRDVGVLFYPAAVTSSGVGRIVALVDRTNQFFPGATTPGALDFCTMTSTGYAGDVIDEIDLPRSLTIAAPPRPLVAPFPYDQVPTPATGCSFCTGVAPDGGPRGAIRYDSRGRATFYDACGGAPLDLPNGGSVALMSTQLNGARVLAILPGTGGVHTYSIE